MGHPYFRKSPYGYVKSPEQTVSIVYQSKLLANNFTNGDFHSELLVYEKVTLRPERLATSPSRVQQKTGLCTNENTIYNNIYFMHDAGTCSCCHNVKFRTFQRWARHRKKRAGLTMLWTRRIRRWPWDN